VTPRPDPQDYANRRQASPMFEIGSSLRAAQMPQRLELPQAKRDTRILAKYLGALETARSEHHDLDLLELVRSKPQRRKLQNALKYEVAERPEQQAPPGDETGARL
jgi:hypothetical protein